ncbi:MAG TPA: 3-phosphoshikimate 1-carboxyvinyltransferase [Eggerthellaceae bacterium]|nr:3-phosphoshikimate 1-carboxyvinyltransferase [Eggerthellaceae bacterium]
MAKTDEPRIVNPLTSPLDGSTVVPGDKSISHRAILFSAMAEGTSRLLGVLDSADVRASIDAVQKLGATVTLEKQPDGSLAGGVEGWGTRGPVQPDGPIYCANSGTTARLLMGVLAPWDIEVRIEGDESLSKRPMRRITAPLMKMGVEFDPAGAETLPITERGCKNLKAITYNSPMASAQLKTAVLLAGVYADGVTELNEPSVSRNHTELMLPEYGVQTTAGERTARVKGPVAMHSAEIHVPGDPSSAAYLTCAAVLKQGSAVQVENVSLNTARTGFLMTLERMGADVTTRRTGSAGKEPYGIISACYTDRLHGCEIPGHKIASLVDEVPVLSLVAAHAHGITVFRNVEELRAKESDRLDAIISGLGKLGVDAWAEGEDLFIEGQPDLRVPEGIVLDSRGDHRLAMTWALVGLTGNAPVGVRGFDCVDVSYPDFLEDIERLCR